jgi:hypothetical protein
MADVGNVVAMRIRNKKKKKEKKKKTKDSAGPIEPMPDE